MKKRYITFKIGKSRIGILNDENLQIEPTLINKLFTDEEGNEYISYRRSRIPVYDTSLILFGEKMKKFDGLLFIKKGDKTIALKTESFFDEEVEFDIEFNVNQLFISSS